MQIDGNKLALEMARKCLSTKQLSEITGISRVTIQRLKAEDQKARLQTIGKLAKVLQVQVEDLIH